MLQSYLQDHLTGAAGGRARVSDMAERYADTPLGPRLRDIADQIDAEHQALAQIIDRLGLRQPLVGRLVARAGELAGRLKPNGRLLRTVPTTALLEIELMRSAVNGKRGLWETLAEHAAELGLDAAEMQQRADDAGEQAQVLAELHGLIRGRAFEAGDQASAG